MSTEKRLDFLRSNEKYTVSIDSNKRGVEISPTFIGIFFEDINYGADGGLYAELIQNRSFEFGTFKDTFSKYDDYLYGWEVFEKGKGKIKKTQGNTEPIHKNNPNYLQVTIEEPGEGVGIRNLGFGGIAISNQENYDFSVYLRNKDYKGNIHIVLEGSSGQVYAKHTIQEGLLTNQWVKHEAQLTSNNADTKARLSIIFEGSGVLDVDMVSLFPEKTWNNRKNGLRHDMVKMLDDLQPKFLRFPGGCIVEGIHLPNAYNWKDTIGPVEHRKINWSRWEDWKDYPYNQSYGLGFYEYFLLSEDIGAAPLPIINCGMSCQFQSGEVADDIEPFIQDALDLIEYANGDANTKWGAKRIEAGHKEPFNLIYLGIGNEQWIDTDKPAQKQYFAIYEMFRNRIKEKYPEIQLITTTGPSPHGKRFEMAWDVITEKTEEYIKENEVYAEIVDEHYYMSPQWFLDNNHRYDNYPRYEDGKSSKVFAGEYACHTSTEIGKSENNLYAALCEASFMTGLERNSDIVAMTAYAPLFAKTTNWQWKPDLIWFDNTRVYGSPSYYVQKMFGNNMGTHTLQTDITSEFQLPQHKRLPIYSIGSIEEHTGDIILKIVNIDEKPHDIRIELKGIENLQSKAEGVYITSQSRSDVNTLEEPTKVSEKTFVLEDVSSDFTYHISAQSFVVLRFPAALK